MRGKQNISFVRPVSVHGFIAQLVSKTGNLVTEVEECHGDKNSLSSYET
jgi:hypothetical protein